MEVLGEALLSRALDFLFGQLASADLLKLASEEGVDTELKNWRTELVGIKLTLSDAEEKQITDCQVKSWLIDLRALVYDMEDIIDEFAYHVMRRKLAVAEADDEPGTSKNPKLSKFIPTCCTDFRPTHTVRLLNLGPKIRNISARLQSISDTKGNLVLKEAIKKASPARRTLIPTTDMACEQVYGRDEDKRLILNMLRKVDQTRENNFGVISIVGPGGVGKTTLARLVYNDDEVAKNFELKAWACVSDVFDLGNIIKSILCSVKGSDGCSSSDFQTVQRQLRDALANKKLLLILDDVWANFDRYWDNLQIPLSVTAKGSKVIVTTRDATAALNMGLGENPHPLKPLSEDACWSVFEKQALAFRNEVDRRELEPTGREIVVKYCRGSPLATKALGGLLRTKCTTEEWKGVLNSKFWELPRMKSEIFPVLFLSYHHLPSHLKRCFVYCAIFPQDYVFEPKTLVLLWMAEGLIAQPNSTGQTMEDLGDQYFHELLSRSFFQQSGSDPSNFVMHDLMHNLAHDVSDDMCLSLEDNLESDQRFQHQINNTRHLSFTPKKLHLFKKLENFKMLQYLRTFVALPIHWRLSPHSGDYSLVNDDLMLKFKELRVLSLSGCMISVLPDFIGGLKHLRYLNLSHTVIESLPCTITKLHNLQTLLLVHCRRLTRLPNDIGNLIRLRHLDVFGCPLEEMPQQIVKLKQLQTLSNLIVGKKGFLGMKCLKDLPNLKERIRIEILQNGVDPQDAINVNLKDKLKNIKMLSIIWRRRGDDSYDEDVFSLQPHTNLKEKDVLFSLQPHTNLKRLFIQDYYGEEFSNWISNPSYSNLVALTLFGCVKCKSLPPVGQLPSLKEFDIIRMDGLESIGVEFEGQVFVGTKPFQCLERLSFHGMKEWKRWSWSPESFSSLRRLQITHCEKLVGELPIHLTSLVELEIWDCPEIKVPLPEDLHSLQKFNSYSCEPRFVYQGRGASRRVLENVTLELFGFKVSEMGGGLYRELKQCLPSAVELLEVDKSGELRWEWVDGFGVGKPHSLEIKGYKHLESLGEEEGYDHGLPLMLTKLSIQGCESLRSLPGWISNCNLQQLNIQRCLSLICFPRGLLTLTLKGLKIENCKSLESLPEDMCMCSALEELLIETCPGVIVFPEGGLPPNLKKLTIFRCEKLGYLPEGIMQMHHDPRSSALQHLSISECTSLACFPSGKFPSTLKSLSIRGCVQLPPIANDMFDPSHNSLEGLTLVKYPNLKTLPDSLHSLKRLCIEECENMELQPHPFRNLTSLESLEISGCKNIKTPISEWGLAGLTSLTSLTIRRMSPDTTLFSLDHHRQLPPLPASLYKLTISGFQNLESLASLSLQTLTSLRTLCILECPKLHSFMPKEGLPDMLAHLAIGGCPLLVQRCTRDAGEDWLKIAHIPQVWLDGRRL